MTLTVILGCHACYEQTVVECPVTERVEGPREYRLMIDTDPIQVWREAHRMPWATTA